VAKIEIESFQSADAQPMLLTALNFGLGNDVQIGDDSHSFETLFYRDKFKCIQFLLVHLTSQAHLEFNQVNLADS
jgi:hypothetical protein